MNKNLNKNVCLYVRFFFDKDISEEMHEGVWCCYEEKLKHNKACTFHGLLNLKKLSKIF